MFLPTGAGVEVLAVGAGADRAWEDLCALRLPAGFGAAFETNERFRPLSSMPTGVDAPMIDLLDQHVHEVASACAKHRVARLDVFGSATRPDFRPGDSDLDLLVDFQPMAPTELVDACDAIATRCRSSA